MQLIALKESYQGYNYTASAIRTKHAVYWRYGRIEARIKLPGSNGFVPAFWLLPEDERYGWWPASGEVDIMEHPTNEVNKIYGTVHTEAYNSFTGSGPRGGIMVVPDAESAFHLYAVEWTPDVIDFFVDDTKYFSFKNENKKFQIWPFDQPFYIILNMAVGGGWVGDPTADTVFPAVMEVDYVRVYQNVEDINICGPDYVSPNEKSLSYFAPLIAGAGYQWSVPNTAKITLGQNSPLIHVDWGFFAGVVELMLTANDGFRLLKYPVAMSNNLLKNADFEKGSKYRKATAGYPAAANFSMSTAKVHSGGRSVFVEVKKPGVNDWDVQLSQTNLELKAGKTYDVSFWAKSATNSGVTAAIINAANYSLYAGKTFQLTNILALYNFEFTAPANATGSFNIDLGGHTGSYSFDDFQLALPPLQTNNQVRNTDFSAGATEWILTTLSGAVAQGRVREGEYAVSITNGGVNPWDVHLGQAGFTIEKGKDYSVSFDAYAATPCEISPIVGKNSNPWNVYSNVGNIQLSTHRQTYTFSFIMQEPTDTQTRLGFDIGTAFGDVFFDNVFLSWGVWPSKAVEASTVPASSFQLYPNWPNPFNPITTIEFELHRACFVSLKIFDIHGELIETVVEKERTAGLHRVLWDGSENSSGVYFCQLVADGKSQINKMILIK